MQLVWKLSSEPRRRTPERGRTQQDEGVGYQPFVRLHRKHGVCGWTPVLQQMPSVLTPNRSVPYQLESKAQRVAKDQDPTARVNLVGDTGPGQQLADVALQPVPALSFLDPRALALRAR